uniref:hypothetical protein n=1 Tax=Agathobacter sp. TaxID=2021311 RepID=UPI00405744DD
MEPKGVAEKVKLWIRKHPDGLWIIGLSILLIIFHIIIAVQSIQPIMVISETSLYQTIGLGSQIVAGMYGITLTGYIFFLDRLQQQVQDNEPLEEVIIALKQRYHRMVILISVCVFVVVVMAVLLTLYGTENILIPEVVHRFLIYETCVMILTTTSFIIYFVLSVVDPDKIQRISFQHKEKLSSSDSEQGDLQEFLKDYEDIEAILKEKTLQATSEYMRRNPIKLIRTKDFLMMQKYMKSSLAQKVAKLTQYHSYLMFSQEMTVSKEMCILAKEVKKEMQEIVIK